MAERGDLSSQISRKSYFSRFLGQKGVETPLLEVTRREAPFELPWADWDDLRLSGYLHDVLSTLVVPDYDKRGPQPPAPILGDF